MSFIQQQDDEELGGGGGLQAPPSEDSTIIQSNVQTVLPTTTQRAASTTTTRRSSSRNWLRWNGTEPESDIVFLDEDDDESEVSNTVHHLVGGGNLPRRNNNGNTEPESDIVFLDEGSSSFHAGEASNSAFVDGFNASSTAFLDRSFDASSTSNISATDPLTTTTTRGKEPSGEKVAEDSILSVELRSPENNAAIPDILGMTSEQSSADQSADDDNTNSNLEEGSGFVAPAPLGGSTVSNPEGTIDVAPLGASVLSSQSAPAATTMPSIPELFPDSVAEQQPVETVIRDEIMEDMKDPMQKESPCKSETSVGGRKVSNLMYGFYILLALVIVGVVVLVVVLTSGNNDNSSSDSDTSNVTAGIPGAPPAVAPPGLGSDLGQNVTAVANDTTMPIPVGSGVTAAPTIPDAGATITTSSPTAAAADTVTENTESQTDFNTTIDDESGGVETNDNLSDQGTDTAAADTSTADAEASPSSNATTPINTIAPTTTVEVPFPAPIEQQQTTTGPTVMPVLNTAAPTVSPMANATATGEVNLSDLPIQDLPEYTLQSLNDPVSPQSRAMAWLQTRPDLATLPDARKKQLFALGTFYYSFEGENWKPSLQSNWLNHDVHECRWGDGLQSEAAICDANGVYLGLQLELEFLPEARMPPEVSLLSSLRRLGFIACNLTDSLPGLIPPQFAENNLPLTEISLRFNEIDGTIPTYIGAFQESMELFRASYNKISGSVPPELWDLSNLETVILHNNMLSGSISSQIGKMENLEVVDLGNNLLTGTIPSEIGNVRLFGLFLDGNDLQGSIPTEIGRMARTRVPSESLFGNSFDFSENSLTGTIPTELGLLEHLDWLDIGNNIGMEGPIPTELGQLSFLVVMLLERAGLSGAIPTELGLLDWLQILDLSGNPDLVGTVPTELGLLTDLESMALGGTGLYGFMPNEVCSNGNLEAVWVNCDKIRCPMTCRCRCV